MLELTLIARGSKRIKLRWIAMRQVILQLRNKDSLGRSDLVNTGCSDVQRSLLIQTTSYCEDRVIRSGTSQVQMIR
jgi:hypothetical protein